MLEENRRTISQVRGRGLKQTPILNASAFAPNDVIALYHRRYADRFVIIIRALIDTDDSTMSTDEYFAAPRDFRRQRKGEIDLRTRNEVLLHREVNAPGGNIPGLATVRPRLPVDGHANVHR